MRTYRLVIYIICLLLSGWVKLRAGDVPVTPRSWDSSKQKADLFRDDKASALLERLKTNYLDPFQFDEKLLGDATSLLSRLPEGHIEREHSVSSEHLAFSQQIPFFAEILGSQAGYLRLGDFNQDILQKMDSALANFNKKKIRAVVLDLRAVRFGNFALAADIVERFSPKGANLFSLERPREKSEHVFASDHEPLFSGVLVVLVDSDTAGASEALAGALRQTAKGVIVGSQTAGRAAATKFANMPLKSDRQLWIAYGRAVVPGALPLFSNGVKPDVLVSMGSQVRDEVFRRSKSEGMSRFVFIPMRPHLSEASLMNNTNPEIEDTENQNAPPPLQDIVLQRGIDIATTILFYENRKKS